LRDQIYVPFDLLSGLPASVANSVAEQIAAGVSLIVQKHRDVVRFDESYKLLSVTHLLPFRSQTEWNLVFAILRLTISHPEAARQSFALILSLAEGPTEFVRVDNFVGLVTLLDDFVTIAGTFAESQQHHGRRNHPSNVSR
jgi:brefeldin A-resistance guanine nucleotide exchange factor 1